MDCMDCYEVYDSFEIGDYEISCDRSYSGYIGEYSYCVSVWDNEGIGDYDKSFDTERESISFYNKLLRLSKTNPAEVINWCKELILASE